MPTPFPGMDPYLEHPNLWHGLHNRLIALLADFLGPLLSPRYFVAVEERSYVDELATPPIITVPDASVVGAYTRQPVRVLERPNNLSQPQVIELSMAEPVRETYLSVQEVGSSDVATEMWLEGEDGLKVVTVLEILSPWNKAAQEGRSQYLRKRNAIFNSQTNFVEIDLLRTGMRFTQVRNSSFHYSVLVSAAAMRPQAHFYPFTVQQPIPIFELPLQDDDEWPVIDLNAILHALYERARYDLRINYRIDPLPPFTGDDKVWVETFLRDVELR